MKCNKINNLMYKNFFPIIATVLAITGLEHPVTASNVYDDMDVNGRSKVVRTQLTMQSELNRLTGKSHGTFVQAINAATNEQCNTVAHSGSGGRQALLDFNSYANQAKHNLSNYNFVNNPWDDE